MAVMASPTMHYTPGYPAAVMTSATMDAFMAVMANPTMHSTPGGYPAAVFDPTVTSMIAGIIAVVIVLRPGPGSGMVFIVR